MSMIFVVRVKSAIIYALSRNLFLYVKEQEAERYYNDYFYGHYPKRHDEITI